MENSSANFCAFSRDREATAATSASSHCSIPGTARRRAIDAALKIPHFTFFVMDSPRLDVSGTLEDYYLQNCDRPFGRVREFSIAGPCLARWQMDLRNQLRPGFCGRLDKKLSPH